nr:unnamed protein product [Haemonchus contortus]
MSTHRSTSSSVQRSSSSSGVSGTSKGSTRPRHHVEAKVAKRKPQMPNQIMVFAGIIVLIIVIVLVCGIFLGWFGGTETEQRNALSINRFNDVYA